MVEWERQFQNSIQQLPQLEDFEQIYMFFGVKFFTDHKLKVRLTQVIVRVKQATVVGRAACPLDVSNQH